MPHIKLRKDAPLRHNCVETFDEFNTGKNIGRTAPYITWDIVPGRDDVKKSSHIWLVAVAPCQDLVKH